jgi:CubicO group peptidase (beta-lactamase class C family)
LKKKVQAAGITTSLQKRESKLKMDKNNQDHIQHMINNLLPAAGKEGKYLPPQSLQDRMDYYHTPGVSIAVIDEFEMAWAQGFGKRDVRLNKDVKRKTLFQAGSISKPVFALAVMRLVQESLLNLDEDIHRYLTSWRVPANESWQPKITLRQILSHSAGLTVQGFPGYQASEPLPTVTQILNGELPANTPEVEVNILPGTQFRYSGGGTTAAQQALVDLLKKPFPQIMRELVLEPLGMTHSTFEQPLPKRWTKSAATAHPRKGIPLKGKFHTYPEMAAAGLWTTTTDLAKMGVELLKVLNGKKAPSLLTKETLEAMLLPQLEGQKLGEGEYCGLGFFCSGKEDGFSFGHSGGDEGFVALMQLYKNIGKGAVAMVNSNEGYPLLDEIFRAVAVEYGWPNALPGEKAAISLPNLSDYVGLYLSETGMRFQVSVMDDYLRLHFGEQPSLPIFPSAELEFFTKAINADIRFEKDDEGRIVRLKLSQEGNQIKADKQASKPKTTD